MRLGPRGSAGCCTCAEFVACDCGPLTAGLECRIRGGAALLCGVSEYTSPSSPPKKYRRVTPSGQFYLCYYQFPNCSGIQSPTDSYDFEDAPDIVYNSATCSRNNPNYTHWVRTGSPAGCSYQESGEALTDGVVPEGTAGASSESFAGGTRTRTQTTFTETYDGTTCLDGGTSNGLIRHGSYTLTLGDEDTEEDAIARVIAPGWSEWTPVSETCQNPGCCKSAWEERVTGFGFIYIEAEFKVKKTGLTPGQAYDIAVDLYRRIYDTGEYELYATMELSATVDGSGILETNATAVPNDVGYETYASSPARLTPVP